MINPELRKGILARFSATKVLSPLLIAAALWFGFSLRSAPLPPEACAGAYVSWLVICTFAGVIAAAGSVGRELRSGTWEQLRISNLSPWSLGWGHLLGATSYTWYLKGAGFALALAVCPDLFLSADPLLTIFLWLSSMLALESYGLSIAVMAAPAARQSRGRFFDVNPVALVSQQVLLIVIPVWLSKQPIQLHTWGIEANDHWFWVFTSSLLLLLCALGLLRAIRRELSLRVSLWYGPINGLILSAYFGVFLIPYPTDGDYLRALSQGLGLCAIINLLLAYYSALLPRTDLLAIARRIQSATAVFHSRDGALPDWIATLLTALVSALLFACSYRIHGNSALLPLLIGVYAIRDIALIVYLDMTRSLRFGPSLKLLIVFLSLYLLFPWLLTKLGLNSLVGLFVHMPRGSEITLQTFAPAVLSAACTFTLALRRVRKIAARA